MNRFVFRFVQNKDDQVLGSDFFYCLMVTYYFYTKVVTLQLLTFTVNVWCLIINMLRCFFCNFRLDSSLEVSGKLLYSATNII